MRFRSSSQVTSLTEVVILFQLAMLQGGDCRKRCFSFSIGQFRIVNRFSNTFYYSNICLYMFPAKPGHLWKGISVPPQTQPSPSSMANCEDYCQFKEAIYKPPPNPTTQLYSLIKMPGFTINDLHIKCRQNNKFKRL